MGFKIALLEEYSTEISKKITMSLKMTAAALLVANSLNVNACQNDNHEFELPANASVVQEIKKDNNFVKDYHSFVKEKQNGIHKTGFGDVAFVFSLQNQEMLLDNLKSTYGIKDTSIVQMAIAPRSDKNQPEIHFMRIPYGEGQYIKIIKYDEGNENGNEREEEISENFEKFKDGFSYYESLEKNFEDFVVLHELFHSPEFIWKKESNVREFFADYGSILTIGINKDLPYEDVKEMLQENRKKRERFYDQTMSTSHFSIELFNWDRYKKIIPSEEEYKKLKQDYKEYSKNSDTPYNFIANYVAERMNPFIKDETQKIKTTTKI